MAQYSAVHGMASGLSMDIRTELQQPEEEVIGFDPAQLEIEIQMLNHQLQEYNTDAISTIEKIAKLCSADEKEKWHEIRTLVDDLQFDTALLQLNAISDSMGANLEEKK